jgi:hypothetical protein
LKEERFGDLISVSSKKHEKMGGSEVWKEDPAYKQLGQFVAESEKA